MPSRDRIGKERITEWLVAWSAGDASARDHLFPVVYRDLARLANSFLTREPADPLIQPTVLVHETFLRLIDQRRVSWRNRAHFFAIASRHMRRILVDQARRRRAEKRGGHLTLVSLDEARQVADPAPLDIERLDSALVDLAAFAPRQARVVELRYFGGLTIAETAEVVAVSPATVKTDWQLARAWLLRELDAPNSMAE